MEVFRVPRVTLIARPQFIEPEHLAVQWRGEASDGERIAEYAGRLCYMSQHNPVHRTTAEYLENIKKQGHGSVLEHAVYVLLIEGISRVLLTRAGAPPRRVRLLADLAALRGRVARRLRHAPAIAGDAKARSRMAGPGHGGAGGVRPVGGRADAALRVGDGQGAPPQNGARSGAERAAERHRSEDRRVRERARMAHDARAALRRGRGARDSADGDRGCCDCCSRKRVRCSPISTSTSATTKQESAARHLSQGLRKNIFFSTHDESCASVPHFVFWFHMRIGLAYNEKPDATPASDAYAEWDDPSTIDAVDQALGLFGSVIRLEADELFPQKLSLARPDIVSTWLKACTGRVVNRTWPALCEYLNIPYTAPIR